MSGTLLWDDDMPKQTSINIAVIRPGYLTVAVIIALAIILRTRDLAAAVFRNTAALVVYSRWQTVSGDSEFPPCQTGYALADAEERIRYALKLVPQDELLWLMYGRLAWLTGRCERAVQDWEQSFALSLQNPVVWFPYLLATEGQRAHPAPNISQLVAAHVFRLGERAREANREQDALQWYRLSVNIYPNIYAAGRLETLYLRSERQEAAIAVWEQLAKFLPESNADHWWALGRIAELAQDWESAAQYYDQGARHSSDPYNFWMRQGVALERLKKWAQAEDVYRRAVAARPDIFWPYMSVGNMRRIQEDYVGALIWYQKAETLAPERYEPKYGTGLVYYFRQEYSAAEEYFRAALAIYPQHAWSAYYLAQSLYRQNQQEKAIKWLEEAIAFYPGQPWNWAVQLGDWLAETGNKEEALAAYRQALEWKPGDERIQAKIRALEN